MLSEIGSVSVMLRKAVFNGNIVVEPPRSADCFVMLFKVLLIVRSNAIIDEYLTQNQESAHFIDAQIKEIRSGGFDLSQ